MRRSRLPVWMQLGDAAAIAAVVAILVLALASYGLAETGWPRAVAFALCALLGAWGAVLWAEGRWSTRSLRPARRLCAMLGAMALAHSLQLIPLPAGLVTGLSAPLRDHVAALAAAGLEPPARLPLSTAPDSSWVGLQQLVASLLLFIGIAPIAARRAGARTLVVVVIGFSVVEALLGLISMLLNPTYRSTGFIYNPNHHAAAILMGIPVYFAGLAEWRRRSEGRLALPILGGQNPLLVVGGAGLLLPVAWLMASSRGSVLAGAVVLPLWLAWEWSGGEVAAPRRRGLLGAAAVLAGIAALIAVLAPKALFQRLFAGDTLAGNARLDLWAAALKGLWELPWTGLGLGGTEYAINRFASIPLVKEPRFAHNDFVQVICDLGLPAALVVAVLAIACLAAWRRARRGTFAEGMLQRAAVASLATLLVQATLDFHLRVPVVGFCALMLAAVVLAPGARRGMRK